VFDLEWDPSRSGDHVVLEAENGEAARLTVADGSVTLARPGHDSWSMPWLGERLRILVDGPVIEVSSTSGILGGAIEPATLRHPVTGRCTAWSVAAQDCEVVRRS